MSNPIANFSQIPKDIPLIQECLENPSLIKTQTVYHESALQHVIDLLQVKENAVYAWDPVSDLKENTLTSFILKELKAQDYEALSVSHVFSYLDLHKINR